MHTACLELIERYTKPKKLAGECSRCLPTLMQWGRTRGLDWLLTHGADPNAADKKTGNTPLHGAARIGSSAKVVNKLLEAGARTDLKNKDGKTPVEVARQAGKDRVVKQLNEAAAKRR